MSRSLYKHKSSSHTETKYMYISSIKLAKRLINQSMYFANIKHFLTNADILTLVKLCKNVYLILSCHAQSHFGHVALALCAISWVTRKRSLAWIYSLLGGQEQEKIGDLKPNIGQTTTKERETATQSRILCSNCSSYNSRSLEPRLLFRLYKEQQQITRVPLITALVQKRESFCKKSPVSKQS